MNVARLFNYLMLLQLLAKPSYASSITRLGFIPSMSANTPASSPDQGRDTVVPQDREQFHKQESEKPSQKQQTKPSTPAAKTVYLVRHAESEENVLYNAARRARHNLIRLRLPDAVDFATTLTLPFQIFCPSVTDAPASKQGRSQIAALHQKFAEMARVRAEDDGFSFFQNRDDTMVIAHSPLKRAQQTCYGMIQEGCNFDTLVMSAIPPNTIVEELGLLREINPREMLLSGNKALDKRIDELEAWIESRPEKHIVLVGHSLYFQRLLHLQQQPFENCDIWKVTYDYEIRNRLNLVEEPKEIGVVDYVMNGDVDGDDPSMEDIVLKAKTIRTSRLPGAWRDLERVYSGMSPNLQSLKRKSDLQETPAKI